MTIYTSKKTGAVYTCINESIEGSLNGVFKTVYTLENIDNPAETKKVTESVLKRWYKKSVEVDFTGAEEKPEKEEPKKAEPEKSDKKASKKKASKKTPKTYEEQTWGLVHTRLSLDSFCELYGISELEYDNVKHLIWFVFEGEYVSRRAWRNEVTGSVWFRYKNAEHELTDVDYEGGAFMDED